MHECRGSYWTDGKSIVGTPVRRPLHKAELPVSGNAPIAAADGRGR